MTESEHRRRAREHLAARRWREAAVECAHVLAHAPEDVRVHLAYASALTSSVDLVIPGMISDEQRAAFEQARDLVRRVTDDLQPDHASAWQQLASIYWTLEDHDSATACDRRAIELDDSSGAAHLDLGLDHFQAERWQDAVAALSAALARDLDPSSLQLALERRSRALANLGQHDHAIADATRVLEIDPDAPGLHDERARLLILVGRLDEALADLATIISRGDEDGAAHRLRADVLARLGGDEAAVAGDRAEADRRLHAWREGGARARWNSLFER